MHITDLLSLKGKTAIIIGGAGKIGLPMVEALSESGAEVFVGSTNTEKSKESIAPLIEKKLDVKVIYLDQSDEKSVSESIDYIKSKSQSPNILINSGVQRPMTNYMEDTAENWENSMSINSKGLFITCRAFGNEMSKNTGGSIINISSVYGIKAPDPSIYEGTTIQTEPDYPYTKGGMIMFSKYLAGYYAKNNVRVNVIAPGGFYNNQEEPFLSQYCKRVPLNRMAYYDDLKGISVFLSSEASNYITGAIIPVDGGFTI